MKNIIILTLFILLSILVGEEGNLKKKTAESLITVNSNLLTPEENLLTSTSEAEITYVQNQVLVKFNVSLSKSEIENTLKDSGFYINQHLVKKLNIWSIEISEFR